MRRQGTPVTPAAAQGTERGEALVALLKDHRDREYLEKEGWYRNTGKIDIEADGDKWHTPGERVKADKARNNELSAAHWHLLRFDGEQIREQMASYCLPRITELINRLGGLEEEGAFAPRLFYDLPEGPAQQLALLEGETPYELD